MATDAKIRKLRHNIQNSFKLKDTDKEFLGTLSNKDLLDIIEVYDKHLGFLTDLIIDLK